MRWNSTDSRPIRPPGRPATLCRAVRHPATHRPLSRLDEALALHQRAVDGQTHPFEGRQGSVAPTLWPRHMRVWAHAMTSGACWQRCTHMARRCRASCLIHARVRAARGLNSALSSWPTRPRARRASLDQPRAVCAAPAAQFPGSCSQRAAGRSRWTSGVDDGFCNGEASGVAGTLDASLAVIRRPAGTSEDAP
jgi:hypothetical protein